MPKKTAIVYWLIPAAPARELFDQIIRILAKEFDAPLFAPHLTLFATREGRQSVKGILRRLETKQVRLQVRGIGFSSKFTKTLFVRFHPNKSLERLMAELGRATKSRTKLPVDPHLSLHYKNLPTNVKRDLARTLKLPFDDVIFDSIQAVCCAVPTSNRADVEAWRVVTTRNLSD